MDGDVWVSPPEIPAITQLLGVTADEFSERYVRRTLRGWVCLKQQDGKEHGCVFLSKEGQCSIYEARPVQCATYPWWPSLLESEEAWQEEAVVPDDQPGEHWSLELGGCEGIDHADAEVVPASTIAERREAALQHWKRFPGFFIKRRSWRL